MKLLRATYWIETPLPLERAAEVMAGEQSTGTFVNVSRETSALRDQFAARVERVEPLGITSMPSLPGSRGGSDQFHQAIITIAWPAQNVGTNLAAVISTVAGNLFELSQLSGIRLLDIELPASFATAYRGPAFGMAGTREVLGVAGRPLVGTIIKPSIGLSPAETADIVAELAHAGIDFLKDDELQTDAPHSPFESRVDAVMRVLDDYRAATGRQVMYAFNISGDLDAMHRHYDYVVARGGSCAMISLNSVGLMAAKQVCDRGQLVIHGHRNGWGMLTRSPALGMDFRAYQKLWRLAGVDQLHVNGIANKFWEPDDSVVRSMAACSEPLIGTPAIVPVVSSGQWGGQAFETYRRTQTLDLLYLAGGGIMAHPHGPTAGVQALRDAWQLAADGLTFDEAVQRSPSLAAAVDKFGGLNK